MHEYHKAVEWVKEANEQATKQGKQKVTKLHVTFGEACDYAPSVVKGYFDEAAIGTPAEGAEFEITVTRSLLQCPKCGTMFQKKLLDYRCPECREEGNPTPSGTEIELTNVECE